MEDPNIGQTNHDSACSPGRSSAVSNLQNTQPRPCFVSIVDSHWSWDTSSVSVQGSQPSRGVMGKAKYKACQTVNRGREGEGASTLGVQSTATAHLAVNWLVDFTRWISWPQLGLGSRCSTVFTITKGSIRASPSLDATRPLTRALWEP